MFDNEIDDEIIAHDMDEYFSNVIAPYLDEWKGEKIIDENKKKFYDTADLISHTELEGSANPKGYKGYFYLHCNYTGNADKNQPSSSN